MDAETFFANFEAIAEAPGGIPRLRELILDLAVSGKLVRQRPDDGSAQDLLSGQSDLIADAREAEGTRARKFTRGTLERAVPASWAPCVLADVAHIVMGNSPPGSTYNEHGDGIPLVNGPVEFSRGPFGSTVLRQYTTAPTRRCVEGDLLVCVRGATTGRTNIAAFDACIGRGVALIRGWGCQQFINYLMWKVGSDLLAQGKGTTFPSISYTHLAGMPLGLPPLAEQHRIVAQVDELMALCDALEARQQARDELRDKLRASALDALMNAETDADLDVAWARIRTHWDDLTDHPDSVDALRQAILQLAVRGKLVPRGATDEPASDAVARLRRPTKVRRGVPEVVKVPEWLARTELPDGWLSLSVAECLRTGVLIDLKDGNHGANHPKKAEFTEEGLPFITAAQVNDGVVDYDGAYKVSGAPLERLRVGFAEPGDVLLTHKGSVGRVAINSRSCVLSPQTTYYRVDDAVLDRSYLAVLLASPFFRRQLDEVKRQTTRDFVSISAQYKMFFALPPIREQERIAQSVEQMLGRMSQLSQRSREVVRAATRFSASAVHHLTV